MSIKHSIWLIIIISISLILSPVRSEAQIVSTSQEKARYVVFFDEQSAFADIEETGVTLIQTYKNINAATVEINNSKLDEIKMNKSVKRIVKEKVVEVNSQVTSYSHEKINLNSKYPTNLKGKGIKIAVIDTGVAQHPDLVIKSGTCTLDKSKCSNSYTDDNGHGTHVAGIIAAQDNSIGVIGVAPEAEIYAIKSLDSKGEGTTSSILAGIDWAITQNVDIINLSLSTSFEDVGMKEIIDKAYQKGILVIAAAGNEGTSDGSADSVQYPARFENVIAVSAVDVNNQRLKTSSTGNDVEIAAPGELILSTIPNGYKYMSGTSMAAPHVTGLAALYMEKFPTLSNVEIRKLLQQNAEDLGEVGRDPLYGYGLAQVDTLNEMADISVPAEVSLNGSVKINMAELLQKYSQYNIYRFDKLIASNSSSPVIFDYGLQGDIKYTINIVENGIEQKAKSLNLDVRLTSPYFSDLSNSQWFSRYMIYLNSQSILFGIKENIIGPSQLVTRAQAVAMMGRALGLDGKERSTRFTDVGSNNFASGYIESAAEKGYLSGFPDGTFRPEQPVTRAEMAILLSNGYVLSKSDKISFSDVNSNVKGAQQISNIANAGITEGYLDGAFRPYEHMSRSTYSVFLARAENDLFK